MPEPASWWVDFCRPDCPEGDCIAEGVCQDPDDELAWFPRLTFDEVLCLPPRRPVETVTVAGDRL